MMKVPCRWLAEYVDIGVSKEEVLNLAERLTLAGLEVEEITYTGRLAGAVVGRVIDHRAHPNSDHLSLCRLDLGQEEVEVICGAANVVADALVPVITVGGELPGGFTITERKLRGVVSQGMICSKEELGLEEHSSGIWNFDPTMDFALGTDLNDLLEYDDIILDIKVTSNRPDCMGIYGIAREVAAITGRPLKPLDTSVHETLPFTAESVSVEVKDENDTPRYTASLMSGITIAPSPLWMQHRLLKAGMRPLSNVVDVTNYVMLELGQPLHPFDADLIDGAIVVCRARKGENFRTLDKVERELSEEVLMITDSKGGLAIAGVMGGERSEISPTTTRILLESAVFDPLRIRRSSRSVGLRSEASHRFERRVDPQGAPLAAARTAHFLQELTGCQVHQGLVDTAPTARVKRTLRLRPRRANALLGIDLSCETIREILKRLEIETAKEGKEIVATIPSFRSDLVREVDLIEEIGRIYGYDRFPSTPPRAVLHIGKKDPQELYKDRVREILTGLGLNEVITDGFNEEIWRRALSLPDEDLVTVRNPMISGQGAMRGSLVPGVLAVVETNLNQGVDGGMIFEVGRIFSRTLGEGEGLAVALFGRTGIPLRGKEEVDLSLAKGILTDLLAGLYLSRIEIAPEDPPSFLHPGRGGRIICEGERIGLFGELAPEIGAKLSISSRVIVFEIDLDKTRDKGKMAQAFQPLPRFPASKRDLSLLAPIDLPEEKVRAAIRAEKTVERVLLYDIYQGEQVTEGHKSLTYEVALRASDRTLTDVEIGKAIARVEKRLAKLGVSLRG
jgi:phenylalanyl-tRNA synthetase beta chain